MTREMLFALAIGYLLGSIPFGLLLTRAAGKGDVVTGWQNKLQSAIALITPSGLLAEQHRKQAAPGTAD